MYIGSWSKGITLLMGSESPCMTVRTQKWPPGLGELLLHLLPSPGFSPFVYQDIARFMGRCYWHSTCNTCDLENHSAEPRLSPLFVVLDPCSGVIPLCGLGFVSDDSGPTAQVGFLGTSVSFSSISPSEAKPSFATGAPDILAWFAPRGSSLSPWDQTYAAGVLALAR